MSLRTAIRWGGPAAMLGGMLWIAGAVVTALQPGAASPPSATCRVAPCGPAAPRTRGPGPAPGRAARRAPSPGAGARRSPRPPRTAAGRWPPAPPGPGVRGAPGAPGTAGSAGGGPGPAPPLARGRGRRRTGPAPAPAPFTPARPSARRRTASGRSATLQAVLRPSGGPPVGRQGGAQGVERLPQLVQVIDRQVQPLRRRDLGSAGLLPRLHPQADVGAELTAIWSIPPSTGTTA